MYIEELIEADVFPKDYLKVIPEKPTIKNLAQEIGKYFEKAEIKIRSYKN